jgi:hypothetical protein
MECRVLLRGYLPGVSLREILKDAFEKRYGVSADLWFRGESMMPALIFDCDGVLVVAASVRCLIVNRGKARPGATITLQDLTACLHS